MLIKTRTFANLLTNSITVSISAPSSFSVCWPPLFVDASLYLRCTPPPPPTHYPQPFHMWRIGGSMQELSKRGTDRQEFIAICDESTQRNNNNTGGTLPVIREYVNILWSLSCWECGFESHGEYGCLSIVTVVCCQVEVSATSWSLVHRCPTECSGSFYVI